MLGRSIIPVLMAAALLAASPVAVAQSWLSVGPSWAGTVCSSCGTVADLHDACCDFGKVCDDCCTCSPRWEASAEFLWMGRTGADRLTLINADVGGLLFPVLNVGDLGFDVGGGVRTSLTRMLDSGRDIELVYMGVFDNTGSQSVTVDPATPLLNNVTYQFFGNNGGIDTAYDAEYQSDLHSFEANVRFRCRYGFVPFAGFRWIRLAEELEVNERAIPTSGVLGEIRNDLVGAQFGLYKDLWTHRRIRIEMKLAAGIFGNSVKLYADEHVAGVPIDVLDRTFSETSTVGEIQVTIVWQPHPGLAFRAGYSGLLMNDVAAVADQVDNFNLGTGLGTLQQGAAGFHGGHIGFEAAW